MKNRKQFSHLGGKTTRTLDESRSNELLVMQTPLATFPVELDVFKSSESESEGGT